MKGLFSLLKNEASCRLKLMTDPGTDEHHINLASLVANNGRTNPETWALLKVAILDTHHSIFINVIKSVDALSN